MASPTSGLMFTNDVMPVKVRWFYAAGADGLPGHVQGERGLTGTRLPSRVGESGESRASAKEEG